MQQLAERLSRRVLEVSEQFHGYSETEVSRRPAPGKWSRKEVLGHLCDSAINNLPRWIKLQFENEPVRVPKYEQNQWVRLQQYQEAPVEETLQLWAGLNRQIARVIAAIPEESYARTCIVGDREPVTLQWLAEDYLDHLEHHLRQIADLRLDRE